MPTPDSRVLRALAPRLWGAHLLMVVVVAAATSLGVWQWTISERAKEAQADALAHGEPVELTEAMGPNEAFPGTYLGRPVVLDGTWMPEATVLVDGRTHHGEDGYWAATPVKIDATGSAIYVVRGWSAGTSLPTPSGQTRLVGWLQPSQQDGLTDEDPEDDVIPEMDTTSQLDRVDADLYAGFVVSAFAEKDWAAEYATTGVAADQLEPVPAPTPPEPDGTEGLRNMLYAFEWWLFAIFGLYVWWRYVADVTRPAPPQDEAGTAEDEPQEGAVPSGS